MILLFVAAVVTAAFCAGGVWGMWYVHRWERDPWVELAVHDRRRR